MNKTFIFTMLFSYVGGCLAHEATNYRQLVQELYESQDHRDKIVRFFQSAVDRFIGKNQEMTFSGEDVVQRFLEINDTVMSEVYFQDYDDFKQWVSKQEKTLLFLSQKDDVACSTFHEYLKKLMKENESKKVDVVKMTLVAFLNNVVRAQESTQSNKIVLHDLDVTPNIIMIEAGQFRQLSLEELLAGLKKEVDEYFRS